MVVSEITDNKCPFLVSLFLSLPFSPIFICLCAHMCMCAYICVCVCEEEYIGQGITSGIIPQEPYTFCWKQGFSLAWNFGLVGQQTPGILFSSELTSGVPCPWPFPWHLQIKLIVRTGAYPFRADSYSLNQDTPLRSFHWVQELRSYLCCGLRAAWINGFHWYLGTPCSLHVMLN